LTYLFNKIFTNLNFEDMRRFVLIIAVIVSAMLFTNVQAQEKEQAKTTAVPTKEHGKCGGCAIAKMKREYLYKNLELTEDVREKFWSIYDKFMQEETKIHENSRLRMEKIGIKRVEGKYDFDAMNEEQILAFYNNHFQEKKEMQDLNYRFYNEIKSVLHPKELVMYFTLDKNFKKTVAGQAREKQGQGKENK
jgi:Spy/CpxP family protein refolding chaperone